MSLHGLGRKSVACITLLGLQLKVRHAVMPIKCHLQHIVSLGKLHSLPRLLWFWEGLS